MSPAPSEPQVDLPDLEPGPTGTIEAPVEDELRAIIDNAPVFLWSDLPDGYCDFLNQPWLAYFNLSLQEAQGAGWATVLHPDDAAHHLESWQRAVSTGIPLETEARFRRFDGEYRWFLTRANPLRDKTGRIVKWYGTNIDIENLKRTEARLRQSEEELQRSQHYLAEAQRLSHIGSWAWSPVSNAILYWSEECYRILGYDPAQGLPSFESSFERIHPEDRPALAETIERAVRERAGFQIDYRLMLPDGTRRSVHIQSQPVLDVSGALVEFIGTVMDVTEQELLTQERRRREAYLAEAQKLSHTGSFGWKPDTGEIIWSAETYRIFGYDRAVTPTIDLVAQRVHPEDRADFQAVIERASAGALEFEHAYRLLLPDGRAKHVHALAHATRDASGNREFVGAVTDTTDRKRAEESLRASEAYLAEAQRLSHTGSWAWSPDSDISYWSEECYRVLSFDPRDGLPRFEEFLQRIHPDDQSGFRELTQRAIREKTEWEADYRIVHPDGLVRDIHVVGHPVLGTSGRLVEFVGTVIDVTDRKRAEQELRTSELERARAEHALRHSQKMEAIGTFAGGIAHDFNNILGAILGYSELAQGKLCEGKALDDELEQVMHASNRGKRLVEQILAFSRSGVGSRVPVHVESAVAETLALLAASLPSGVRLEQKLSAGDAAVVGDATQLHQVAMNLCTNAVQAMARGGVLTVTLDRMELAQQRPLSHGVLEPGVYVRLSVADTGSGIPRTALERIFDPFFTTKGVGKGTGLGLSLVHGIVADSRGAIDVATREGAGTTFTVWLPCSGETAAPAVEDFAELPQGHGESVMIVDDEQPLVRLAEETLAQLGYDPAGFDSSVAALEAFRAEPQRYDLLLTDQTMPDLTGTELAQAIRQLRPELPIVLMSGYKGSQLNALAQAAGVSAILHKPLVSRDIAESIARALPRT